MNYEIIKNESQLDDFIQWLPELKNDEKYMIFLFARKKYCPSLSTDKAQLKRVLSDKDRIKEKIRQMEIAIGEYKVDGETIPQQALALYITANPRSLTKAMRSQVKSLVDAICENKYMNVVSEALTAVHQSLGTNWFKDFDFDGVDLESTLVEMEKVINLSAVHFVRTRGGFHALVEMTAIEPQFNKLWYMGLSRINGCDVRGDNLIPVVGCVQSEFVPYFIF